MAGGEHWSEVESCRGQSVVEGNVGHSEVDDGIWQLEVEEIASFFLYSHTVYSSSPGTISKSFFVFCHSRKIHYIVSITYLK